jgi:hypothetical protein
MRITKTIFLSVLATVIGALAGCVTPPDLSGTGVTCTVDPNKPNPHQITYGIKSDKKTLLEVKQKLEVKQQTALVFKLKPKGSDLNGNSYANLDVTVVGKTATDKVWIGEKISQGDGSLIAFCAPSVASDTPYNYEVYVEGLGMLDPRVDVKQ